MSSQLQPSNPFDTPAPSVAGLNAESGMNTPHTPPNDHTLLAPETHGEERYTEKSAVESGRPSRTKWILAGAGVLAVLIVVIVVPVYFTVIKPKDTHSQSNISADGNNNNNTSSGGPPPDVQNHVATTGGDGSIVNTANGNFTYKNSFGGFWVYDPKDPFNNGAKAQVRIHLGPGMWRPF